MPVPWLPCSSCSDVFTAVHRSRHCIPYYRAGSEQYLFDDLLEKPFDLVEWCRFDDSAQCTAQGTSRTGTARYYALQVCLDTYFRGIDVWAVRKSRDCGLLGLDTGDHQECCQWDSYSGTPEHWKFGMGSSRRWRWTRRNVSASTQIHLNVWTLTSFREQVPSLLL